MRYLLRWVCKGCNRGFSTYLQTGDEWPTHCFECQRCLP